MKSHKLELSKETLRCLTSDLPSQLLGDVRGGVDASQGTCISCLECATDAIDVSPTWINASCWCPRPTFACG